MYFGTPVVLISTLNEDGTANLAPMSSAWWLNQSCMLGLSTRGKTMEKLLLSQRLCRNEVLREGIFNGLPVTEV